MANDYFKFRQFTVWQDRCAMKVGTDGTLLGAWASVPDQERRVLDIGAEMPHDERRVLDIGTGTGLLALMMAQRFPDVQVTAIDIDPEAVAQARQNVLASPFAGRIIAEQADARTFEALLFDAIVCNPPYFDRSLTSPDARRTLARHTDTLPFDALMHSAFRLLASHGIFSLVVPADSTGRLISEASLAGFCLSRLCAVKTTPRKPPKRCLVEFRKSPVSEPIKQQVHPTTAPLNEEVILELSPGVRSPWYASLTHDFYLNNDDFYPTRQ